MQVDLKRLKPLGVVLVLLIGVLTIVTFFTADFGVPPPYTPMRDAEYYRQHLDELLTELRENVLPDLKGVVSTDIPPGGGVIEIRVEQKELDKVKAVIIRDFGESLFEFIVAPQ